MFMNNMRKFIDRKISAGEVPADWDAHELREWLAQEFLFEARVDCGPRGVRPARNRVAIARAKMTR